MTTQPDYYREAVTVSVPIDEHPGEIHLLIGADPIRVRLTPAQAVSIAGDLLIAVNDYFTTEDT